MIEQAWLAAEQAQKRAGVRIHTLEEPIQQAVGARVFDQVWPPGSGGTHVKSHLLRALIHCGGYLSAAFDAKTGDALGAALAVVGRYRQDQSESGDLWCTYLHSDMAGVVEGHRDRSIGRAIKLHQRAWALSMDIDTIVWSFDPLVRRNAWFNLHKLGAEVRGYEPNFYGEMDDAINAGDPSDRVFAWWELTSERANNAIPNALPPVSPRDDESTRVIRTPEDIVSLRKEAPSDAAGWRLRVRAEFLKALDDGLVVQGLDAHGSYVLVKANT